MKVISSRRNSILLIICLLIGFMLLGLTRRAFAVSSCTEGSSTWTFESVTYYDCIDDLLEAESSVPSNYYSYFGGQAVSGNSVINGCVGVPDGSRVWLRYPAPYVNYRLYVLNKNAPADACETCASERATLEVQCGGADKYTIDEETCLGRCNCPSECVQQCADLQQRCPLGYSMVYADGNCYGDCNVSSYCADEYEAKCVECGSCDNIRSFDDRTCTGLCKNETCVAKMDEADQACPFGYSMNFDTCSYKCKTCDDLHRQCLEKCGGEDKISMGTCEESNGHVINFICECEQPNNCDTFYKHCYRLCSSDECGGVKTKQCEESGGEVVYSKCQCNTCGKDTPPGDPGDPGDEPSDDPGDGSDLLSWIKAIKENTDTMVTQGNDHSRWFSSLNQNTDEVEDLLRAISRKDMSVSVAGTDVSGVISSVNNVNSTLQGVGSDVRIIKDGIGSVSEGVGDIKEGLSNLDIGTEVGGYTGDEVSEGDYGEAPTDSDLPTKEAIDSAFGTYTPPEDSNRDLIKDTIAGFIPQVGSSDCNLSISLPVPNLSGLSWHSFSLNFCQYESIFIMIGNALVFLTALHELYRLA